MFFSLFAEPTPTRPEPATDADVLDEELDDAEDVGDEVKAVLVRMLPWALSLVGHAAVIVIAVLAVFFISELDEEEERPIIPSIQLSDDPGAPLEMQMTEELEDSSAQQAVVQTNVASVTPSNVEFTADVFANAGVGAVSGNPFGNTGVGVGTSTGFFGSGGNARSVVFVIDASGSLIDTYPFVIDELKRSILKLSDEQAFHVVFFTGTTDRPVYALGQRGRMFRGTQNDKNRVIDWIDIDSHNVEIGGSGDPITGIQAALALQPELLYLLSDNITGTGQYEVNRGRLLREVADANRSNTKINTIQFLYPDAVNPDDRSQWTLWRMAEATGGRFKFVSADELNQ